MIDDMTEDRISPIISEMYRLLGFSQMLKRKNENMIELCMTLQTVTKV